MKRVLAFSVLAIFSYCSSRPVLYDNYKLRQMGERNAEIDIDQCMRQAKGGGDGGPSVGGIGTDAVVSGVTGGCSGLFSGNPISGAASGAMGAVQSGSSNYAGSKTRNAIEGGGGGSKEDRVEACLRAKGYQVGGWK